MRQRSSSRWPRASKARGIKADQSEKMRKEVFLDIGAHYGGQLIALRELGALDRFAAVHCFEPAAEAYQKLRGQEAGRSNVYLHNFGLGASSGEAVLYGGGALGASIYQSKQSVCASGTEKIVIVDVATWWQQNIADDSIVYVKMNCEGGEYEIVKRLAEAEILSSISALAIHFDLEKVPEMASRKGELVKYLDGSGVDWADAKYCMPGVSYTSKMQSFLRWVDASDLERFWIMSFVRYKSNARKRFARVAASIKTSEFYS